MVEELLPAFVSFMAEVDACQRVMSGFYRVLDKFHAGDFRSSAALFDVTGRAGTNDVFPRGFAAHGPGDYMVERQFAGREALAAVLTSVFVAGEDISAIEFHFVSRQAVVEQQPDDSWYGDIDIDGGDPIISVRLEISPEPADLAPALEIIIGISVIFE